MVKMIMWFYNTIKKMRYEYFNFSHGLRMVDNWYYYKKNRIMQ